MKSCCLYFRPLTCGFTFQGLWGKVWGKVWDKGLWSLGKVGALRVLGRVTARLFESKKRKESSRQGGEGYKAQEQEVRRKTWKAARRACASVNLRGRKRGCTLEGESNLGFEDMEDPRPETRRTLNPKEETSEANGMLVHTERRRSKYPIPGKDSKLEC